MFWGTQLKQGQPHKLSAEEGVTVIHVSNAALAEGEAKV